MYERIVTKKRKSKKYENSHNEMFAMTIQGTMCMERRQEIFFMLMMNAARTVRRLNREVGCLSWFFGSRSNIPMEQRAMQRERHIPMRFHSAAEVQRDSKSRLQG